MKNSFENLENILQLQEKKLVEIDIENERLDQKIEAFYEEFEVNEQNLSTFLSQETNFCKENWETIQIEKKKMEEKLKSDLENIANPFRLKKVYKQRKVETHWLFVR